MLYKKFTVIKAARLKIYFCVLLSVATCSYSCCKGTITITPDPENTKTITLKMQFPDSETRATIEPPYVNSAAVISAVDVYFYNEESGEIDKKATLTASERIQILSESGLLFSNLDIGVNGIAIIANNNKQKAISVDEGRNMYDLFNKQFSIAHEQFVHNITLYGKSTSFLEIKPSNADPKVDYYATSITIRPLVARMEISALECVEIDIIGPIQSLILHSVFIDHTYRLATLDTKKVIDLSFLQADAATIEALPSAWWIYSYNSNFPSIPNTAINNNETPFSPDVSNPTQLGDGVFAFHFIPSSAKPWLRLYMRSSASNIAWYLTVRGFTRENAPVTFDPGYVYKVKLPFEEKDVTEFFDSLREVSVEVTVEDWTIINDIIPGT